MDKQANNNQVDTLIDQAISQAIYSQYIYSKAEFDNAKDTKTLIEAANSNAKLLTNAVKYRLADRIEELLLAKIEDVVQRGEAIVRIGGRLYKVTDMANKDPDGTQGESKPSSKVKIN